MTLRPTTHNSHPATLHPQNSIELQIEELVLHSLPFSRGQGIEVQAAVEAELARLLTEQGLSRSAAGTTPHLSAASIELTNDNKPAHVGHQIARAIFRGLTQAPTSLRQTRSIEGASE